MAGRTEFLTLHARGGNDRTICDVPTERRAPTDDIFCLRMAQGVREAERCGRAVFDQRQEAVRYGKGWSEFWTWCERNGYGGATLPVSIDALTDWLTWAVEELSGREIERVLAAVRQRHVDAGLAAHIEGLGG